MKVNDELTSSELQKLLRDERNVSSTKQNVRRKIGWRHEMTRIMKLELDFCSSDARRGQFGRKMRALWTQDAGAMDARRGRCGRKTRALWTQDAGAVDARRGQTQC